MNRRVIASAVLAFSMLVGAASVVSAAPLAPGGTVPLGGTSLAGDPTLAGVVIGSVGAPFAGLDVGGAVRFTGFMESHCVRETASGNVSIDYQVNNDANSLDAIGQLTNTDFSGWATDVDFRVDAMFGIGGESANPGTPGARATESTRGAVIGDEVRFHFIDPPFPGAAGALGQGQTSLWHVIRTNAPACELGNTAVINGGNVNVVTFQPVPEPATMGLVALGAVALLRRRR